MTTEIRVTRIGGPTTLVEVGGWRLLTDPTFDPPADPTGSDGDRTHGR
jgi:L-ascorbate metabolism protein UlaG (beta-lactamase superfamily)